MGKAGVMGRRGIVAAAVWRERENNNIIDVKI